MKVIGLIGGMSWESSLLYYREINEQVKRTLGGLHSAKCILYSVDFHEIEERQRLGLWDQLDNMMIDAAKSLEHAGADFLILCTNTMHKSAPAIEAAVKIPLLHIADPTALALKKKGINKVGLLGTRFTMIEDFYKQRLTEKFGLEVLIPDETEINEVHRIIYEELVKGIVKPESRAIYQEIISNLAERGAQGVILGCTEITLLIKLNDVHLPVFDTTSLHAQHAVAISLEQKLTASITA
jgi:aspartate racemase